MLSFAIVCFEICFLSTFLLFYDNLEKKVICFYTVEGFLYTMFSKESDLSERSQSTPKVLLKSSTNGGSVKAIPWSELNIASRPNLREPTFQREHS